MIDRPVAAPSLAMSLGKGRSLGVVSTVDFIVFLHFTTGLHVFHGKATKIIPNGNFEAFFDIWDQKSTRAGILAHFSTKIKENRRLGITFTDFLGRKSIG
jgi:hypothetical protein